MWKGNLGGVLLAAAVPCAFTGGSIDVKRYEVKVSVLADSLQADVRIEATAGELPPSWTLELAPAMEVRSATVNGRSLRHERKGSDLVVDLSGSGAAAGDLVLEFNVAGRPQERFSEERGGFVRSDVSAEIAYVRSQVAWYPRAEGDAALWRAVLDVPKGWLARTPGAVSGPEDSSDRSRWTFEEARPVVTAGLVAGPYRRVEKAATAGGPHLDALVFPDNEKGAASLLATARKALDRYSAWFGKVEARHFTLVEMPAAFGAGSGYGESGYVLLGKGAFEDAGRASWAESLVAHEVAHTWWGREVGFTTFAGEALATYAANRYLDAEIGPDAARSERQRAIGAVTRAASAGKTVAFSDIKPWGAGMDSETYHAHAYDKAMMLLVMVEDALGRAQMDRRLSAFFTKHRGARVDWPELREALASAGPSARAVLDQGEAPGVPELTVSHEAKKSGERWAVEGVIIQTGTPKPWRLDLKLAAEAGGKQAGDKVRLEGASAKFRLSLPAPPDAVTIDPDFRILAGRSAAGAPDPKEVVTRCLTIVNDVKASDPKVLEPVIAELRALIKSGAGDSEPVCHTGLGRALFRLGRHDEAKKELDLALAGGAGGPFHRAWCHLRLGCMADLEGRRKDALDHYEKARGPGASKTVVAMATRFLDKPYRGYREDG